MSEYVSNTQLKKKLKTYLNENNCDNFKISSYGKYLIITLIMFIEEFLSDALKYTTKNETDGLYKVTTLILNATLNESNKYNIMIKYNKNYDSKIKYSDSVFFNIKKVLDHLESKYGMKLMIDIESKNLLSYMLLSFQYDLLNLSTRFVKHSKKRTLNLSSLISSIEFLLSEEIVSKILLKLDSIDDDKNTEAEGAEEAEVEAEEVEETEETDDGDNDEDN
jgi:hypothetical protein